MGRFEGKNVIVTGGSSGIGRAVVLAFAEEGAGVLAAGRDADRLSAVRAEAPPGRVETAVVDGSIPEEAKRMVRDAVGRMGRVHVLVNNAGIALSDGVLEITEETWNLTLATNLTGAFFASQEAARHMVEEGGGAIVNVASIDAIAAESPQADYNVSKAGMVMMTKSFAHELGHLGIRCNAVAPGLTLTPMVEQDVADDVFRRDYLRQIPMRRAGRPGEQAAVVLFLASEEASFVNGETVVVDGGQLTGAWYDARLAPPVPEG
ncbi:MAG: SDR family oxidoreductase [Actinobacteria bacterium]|nr:SDR family oxidoreductase [Actinomycetota bacterium]